MTKYVYRPNHPQADGYGMVNVEIAGPRYSSNSATNVISDNMPDTRHMADGKYYNSKSQFRAATKAAGCREVGNELPTLLKPRQPVSLNRQNRRDALRRTIYELRNGIKN